MKSMREVERIVREGMKWAIEHVDGHSDLAWAAKNTALEIQQYLTGIDDVVSPDGELATAVEVEDEIVCDIGGDV